MPQMTYQEYIEKFREAQMSGKIATEEKEWSEEEFIFFTTPLKPTPDLNKQTSFRLSYKELYLRIMKLIEKGNAENKEEQLAELKKIYDEQAEKLNLQ